MCMFSIVNEYNVPFTGGKPQRVVVFVAAATLFDVHLLAGRAPGGIVHYCFSVVSHLRNMK